MRRDYPAGHIVAMHRHDRDQLVYCASGIMQVETSGRLWMAPPQRALWIPAGEDHWMQTMGPVSLCTLYLRPDTRPAGFPDVPQAIEVTALLRELILSAAGISADYDETGRDGRLLALLLEEIAWAPDRALPVPQGRDRRLDRICRAIVAEPGDNRSLEEWALQVGASTRTLARLFQAELGQSFHAWRAMVRAQAALPRLAAGDPVTVIAGDLGYETPGAFSTMFRRFMGRSPSRYFAG
ncbi:MAG: AraC family transcriptional regulator [Telmatospirillum sp.]|nr:AraC family transcriptional regulator [Telmatospirillum sp.]